MKASLNMEGGDGRLGLMHQEMMQLKRSMNRSNCIVAGLGVLVLVLTIALVAVGAKQGHSIKHLKARQGLLPHPNVTFATRSGDRNVDGLTYGGSLFRGSGFWSAKKALKGGSLTDHAAVGYGEVVFILGGAKEGGNVTSEVWKYDSVFHNYTLMAPMPEPRYRFGAAIVEDTIYVVGGRNTSDALSAVPEDGLVKSTFIYDILTNTWRRGANSLDFQGDTCAAALQGKAIALLDGDRIMLVGGEGHYHDNDDYKYPKHVTEVYYLSDETWVQKAMIPTARFRTAAATAGGLTYVVGGADVCIDDPVCPGLSQNEVFLDVDHPHVYIYLKNEAYDDNAAMTTYPL